jgi:hypothetical protein
LTALSRRIDADRRACADVSGHLFQSGTRGRALGRGAQYDDIQAERLELLLDATSQRSDRIGGNDRDQGRPGRGFGNAGPDREEGEDSEPRKKRRSPSPTRELEVITTAVH